MSDTETIRLQLTSDVTINAVISRPSEPNQQAQRPTIVFLHFWGGSHKTWSHVNPIISRDYTTVVIDLRGWGESTGPARADAYSISDLADDVEATIDALTIPGPVVLVGLSMGAKTAQLIAGRGKLASGRLAGLVLVSPAPPTPLVLPPDMQDQQKHAYDHADLARFVAENVLTAAPLSKGDSSLIIADMLRGNQWARTAWPAYAMGEDISAQARQIQVPVLVVAGAKDIVEPLDRVRDEVMQIIPGAELTVLPNSGHLCPFDQPTELASHIIEFLHSLHL